MKLARYQNGVFLRENNAAFFKLCFLLKFFENPFNMDTFRRVLSFADVNDEFMKTIGRRILQDAILRKDYLLAVLQAGIVPDETFVELDFDGKEKDPDDYSQRLSFIKRLLRNMTRWFGVGNMKTNSYMKLIHKHILTKPFLDKYSSLLLHEAIRAQDATSLKYIIDLGAQPDETTGMLTKAYAISDGRRKVNTQIPEIVHKNFPWLSFDYIFTKPPTVDTIYPGTTLFTLRGDAYEHEEHDLAFFCDNIELCQRAASLPQNKHTFRVNQPLKLLRIHTWRHELFKDLHLGFKHLERVLLDYCKTHNLDGWMAKTLMDNRNLIFEDASYEYALLQESVSKLDEISVKRFLRIG